MDAHEAARGAPGDVADATIHEDFFAQTYDAVVFGGGLCGIGTALTLKDAGGSVLLVGRRPQLGWEITAAFNDRLGADGSDMAGRMIELFQARGAYRNGVVSPPSAEVLLDELMETAGIDVLLYSTPIQLLMAKGRVNGVVIGNKGGTQILRANAYVDATERAALWRRTGIRLVENDSHESVYSIVFNRIAAPVQRQTVPLPDGFTGQAAIVPSAWDEECRVEFHIESDSMTAARLRVPEVISHVRAAVPALKDAIVSHTGYALWPMDSREHLEADCIRHPTVGNLFAAGLWAVADGEERRRNNTPVGRINLGEKTARKMIRTKIGVVGPLPERFVAEVQDAGERYDYAVVVAGGGTSGALAAIAAGRRNVRTAVVEAGSILGGIGTAGGIHVYYYGLTGGLQDEVDRRVEEMTPLFSGKYRVRGFHPEAKKVVLEQMCAEAGVEILYEMTVFGTESGGRPPAALLAATPTGWARCSGHVVVDATADGDVAIAAGAPYAVGRAIDGLAHSYSVPVGLWDGVKNEMFGRNFDAGYVDPFDVADLTRGRRLGLSLLRRTHDCAADRLLYVAPLIGLRQSRQVEGDYILTLEDLIEGKKFHDCISYTWSHYDNHFVSFYDVANQDDHAIFWTWVLAKFWDELGGDVPYRCLLPKGVEGVLVTGRALSVDVEATYALRMQRDLQRVGEAAGIAAALSARLGVTPRNLDVVLLQDELRKTGALDESLCPPPALPQRSLQETEAMFLSGRPRDAAWLMAFRQDAIPFLKGMLANDEVPEDLHFWAASALAMHRQTEAVPLLMRFVADRTVAPLGGDRWSAASWICAVILLGRIGDKRAVPVLRDVLFDRSAALDPLIACIRALGRMGDPEAAPLLDEFLRRDDLPAVRELGRFAEAQAKDDARWQIEIAAAEAFQKMGRPRDNLAEKHLRDPRSYVRRYAAAIIRRRESQSARPRAAR